LQADDPDINPDWTEKAEEAVEEVTGDDSNISTTKQRQYVGQEAGEQILKQGLF
jgi:hypothetical protein